MNRRQKVFFILIFRNIVENFSQLVEMFDGNVTQCYPDCGNVFQCYNVIPEGLGEDLKLEDDKIYEEELWMAFVH